MDRSSSKIIDRSYTVPKQNNRISDDIVKKFDLPAQEERVVRSLCQHSSDRNS